MFFFLYQFISNTFTPFHIILCVAYVANDDYIIFIIIIVMIIVVVVIIMSIITIDIKVKMGALLLQSVALISTAFVL